MDKMTLCDCCDQRDPGHVVQTFLQVSTTTASRGSCNNDRKGENMPAVGPAGPLLTVEQINEEAVLANSDSDGIFELEQDAPKKDLKLIFREQPCRYR